MNFFSTLCKTLTRRTASLFCTLLICLCQSSALSSRCESWLTCLKFAKGCEKSETWFRAALIRISRTVLIRQAKKHIWFLMSQPLTLLCVPAPPATNERKSWNRTNLMASPIPSQSEDIGRSMWLSAEIRTNLLSFSVKHNAIVTFDLVLEKNEKKKSKELEVSRKNAKNFHSFFLRRTSADFFQPAPARLGWFFFFDVYTTRESITFLSLSLSRFSSFPPCSASSFIEASTSSSISSECSSSDDVMRRELRCQMIFQWNFIHSWNKLCYLLHIVALLSFDRI